MRARITRGQGPVRITRELRQRGIAEADAQAALAAAAVDWDELAARVLARQFRAVAADTKARARQQRFLEYRGFTTTQIRVALRAHGTQADDDASFDDA